MQDNSNHSHHYETGSTNPPKPNRGLVTVLLVAVILLTGITQALGLMNIRLFQQLQQQQDPSMAAISDLSTDPTELLKDAPACLGIRGAAVDEFYQVYYRYPKGLYITDVESGCDSAAQGIRCGDILLTLDGHPICDEAALLGLLQSYRAEDTVTAVIYRDGRHHTISVKLTKGAK